MRRAHLFERKHTRMCARACTRGGGKGGENSRACACGITMHVREEGPGEGNVRGEVGHHDSLVKLQHALSS